MRYLGRTAAFVYAAALTGCATLMPPPMPQLEPGFAREAVKLGSSNCSPNHCRHNVRVGSHKFRVETRTRVASDKDASVAERAAGGLIGWSLRQAGLNTMDEQAVVGTRTVTEEGSPWSLVCDVAWRDERERSKDETTHKRLTQGMDCRQQGVADSTSVAEPWRFRYAGLGDSVSFQRAGDPPLVHRMTSQPFGKLFGVPRSGGWLIQDNDGKTIAALRLPPEFFCLGDCAVDFGEAKAEERDVLRFVAAALMVPLQR